MDPYEKGKFESQRADIVSFERTLLTPFMDLLAACKFIVAGFVAVLWLFGVWVFGYIGELA